MAAHITRALRKKHTPWEAKFWSYVRNRNVSGLKFRRQFKIGNFVADFCCLKSKLIVELDGGHHNIVEQKYRDMERQRFFESQGYKVLRFWNSDVDHNLDGVLLKIIQNS